MLRAVEQFGVVATVARSPECDEHAEEGEAM
jgi:hypothetical protein